MNPPRAAPWLFGRTTDLLAFGGSALVSVLLVVAAPRFGWSGDTPLWAWLMLVVFIDVAHVWATVYRVYFDEAELRRRPQLYFGIPVGAYVVGWALHQVSAGTFWRALVYLALFHFIRQQYGWMALYGRKEQVGRGDRWLDAVAIYAATVGPALWWHANLPRPFWWFVENDFVGLPAWVGAAALGTHWVVLCVWALRQAWRWRCGHPPSVGKAVLLGATWTCWYGGIVLAQDDFSFTAMNVVLHGAPYFVLLHRYAQGRAEDEGYRVGRLFSRAAWSFGGVLVAVALVEELAWDTLVWHDRPDLFGAGITLWPEWVSLLVPLLAVPQVTHYVLDAFIWKPGRDPDLLRRLGWMKASA